MKYPIDEDMVKLLLWNSEGMDWNCLWFALEEEDFPWSESIQNDFDYHKKVFFEVVTALIAKGYLSLTNSVSGENYSHLSASEQISMLKSIFPDLDRLKQIDTQGFRFDIGYALHIWSILYDEQHCLYAPEWTRVY